MTSEVERAIEALSGDPLLAERAGEPAAVIVWDAAIARVLHASESAEPARALAADPSGRVTLAGPAAARLKELAAGLASGDRFRLELLRFGSDPRVPASMLACRRLELESGPALMTVIVGGMPGVRRAARIELPISKAAPEPTPVWAEPSPVAEPEPVDAAPPEAAIEPERDVLAEALARRRASGPRRFLWSADRDGRIAAVSPGLSAAIGPIHADLLGKRWDELAPSTILGPAAEIARRIAAGEAWRDVEVAWRIDEPGHAAPVTLGGMPVRAPDGRIEGFRGSGFVRVAEIAPIAELEPERPHVAEDGPAGSAVATLPPEVDAPLDGERPAPVEADSEPEAAILSFAERGALHEIARALGARFESEHDRGPARPTAEIVSLPVVKPREIDPLRILDQVPVGLAVLRGETPIFVNAKLLGLLGYSDLAEIVARGAASSLADRREAGRPAAAAAATIATRSGASIQVDAEWSAIAWGDLPAVLVTVRERPGADPAAEAEAARLDLAAARARSAALAAALDVAGIGTATLDGSGRILALSRSAERLFGYEEREIVGEAFTTLIAPGGHGDAEDLLARAPHGDDAAAAEERRIVARLRDGRDAPLVMRACRLGPDPSVRTLLWRGEASSWEPRAASHEGALPARHAQFLARISHEIRTPVNAIVGFAELMLEERFGPIDNARYRTYLRDIQRSGEQVVTLVSDLMNLAQVSAGQGELVFRSLDLNHLVAESVASLQPAASRDRVVVRTSLGPNLARVVADERSIRQIALNLLANAIRFTGPGGQVIVSTARTDRGEMAFRVRDTGSGMTAAEVDAALQPFMRMSETRRGDVTELGLPLSKALAEANHASFSIASGRREGTLVEVVFPPARKAAE